MNSTDQSIYDLHKVPLTRNSSKLILTNTAWLSNAYLPLRDSNASEINLHLVHLEENKKNL